jgi:predicted transcriptional regulator
MELGLTENEAKAYITISEEGKITAPKLQKMLNVSLVSTHSILDSLKNMNIIQSEKFGKRRFYFINNPYSLLKLIEMEKKQFLEDIEEKKETAQKIIPILSTLYNLRFEDVKVKFSQGPNGMLEIRSMISNLKNDTVYEFVNFDCNPFKKEKRGDFLSVYRKRKISFVSFYTSRNADNIPQVSSKIIKYLAYLPFEEFGNLPADVYIISNRTVILLNTPKSPILIIESKKIAETFKTFFKMAQKLLPNLANKKNKT